MDNVTGGGWWNYRVFQWQVPTGEGDVTAPELYIGEAYYSAAGEIMGHTGPVGSVGDTVDELRDDLQHMLAALDQPVVDDMQQGAVTVPERIEAARAALRAADVERGRIQVTLERSRRVRARALRALRVLRGGLVR